MLRRQLSDSSGGARRSKHCQTVLQDAASVAAGRKRHGPNSGGGSQPTRARTNTPHATDRERGTTKQGPRGYASGPSSVIGEANNRTGHSVTAVSSPAGDSPKPRTADRVYRRPDEHAAKRGRPQAARMRANVTMHVRGATCMYA